jgi:hypothetical protein
MLTKSKHVVTCQLNAGQWSKQSAVFTEYLVLTSSPVNIHLIKRRTGDSSQCNIGSASPLITHSTATHDNLSLRSRGLSAMDSPFARRECRSKWWDNWNTRRGWTPSASNHNRPPAVHMAGTFIQNILSKHSYLLLKEINYLLEK